jgi:phage repressor protein C with HTH and peptisase S24 domain
MHKTKEFARRIKKVREARNWSQADLAEFLGVSSGSVGHWEIGRSEPTRRNLTEIAGKLGLSEGQLTGAEELNDDRPGEKGGKPEKPKGITSNARFEPQLFLRMVPVVSWAAAGAAHDYQDMCNQIEEEIETESRDPNAFAIIIEGDSMEPDFLAGDRLIIAPNGEARNGDFVIAKIRDDGVIFKRFRRASPDGKMIRLESLNPAYDPIERPRVDLQFVYPVVAMKRKFLR